MSPQLPTHVPSRAHDIIVACIIGPIVSTIIVGIRVWTRVFVTHNLGWDDYAAVITLPFCIGFSIVLGLSTQYGMGLHLKDVRNFLICSTVSVFVTCLMETEFAKPHQALKQDARIVSWVSMRNADSNVVIR